MLAFRFALALVVVTLMFGCTTETGPSQERFIASLSGANENPPVNTSASGTAEFTVEEDGSVSFTLDVANMTGIRAAHIHGPASRTENRGILVSLFPLTSGTITPTGTVNGRLEAGRFRQEHVTGISMDSLLRLMRNGNSYVNVHTTANPAGEIRGQIEAR